MWLWLQVWTPNVLQKSVWFIANGLDLSRVSPLSRKRESWIIIVRMYIPASRIKTCFQSVSAQCLSKQDSYTVIQCVGKNTEVLEWYFPYNLRNNWIISWIWVTDYCHIIIIIYLRRSHAVSEKNYYVILHVSQEIPSVVEGWNTTATTTNGKDKKKKIFHLAFSAISIIKDLFVFASTLNKILKLHVIRAPSSVDPGILL